MQLEIFVVALVLLAAALHAGWNTLVKLTGDRLPTLAVVMGTGAVLGLAAAPLLDVPARASWPYLFATAAIHNGYIVLLHFSYRFGDLGHVYPIARGTAPLLVAGLSAAVAGEVPSGVQAAALVLVSAGIASLAFLHGRPSGEGARPLLFALGTGLTIGAYTVIDGLGVRRSGSPLGYIAWQTAAGGVPFALAVVALRGARVRRALAGRAGASAMIAGLVAAVAYGIVIFAMSRGPMAPVAALRETSVVFAALFGARLLGEPFGARRTAAAAAVAGGLLLLHGAG